MDAYVASLGQGIIITNQTVSEYALPWLKRTYPTVAESTYTGLAIHLQHLVDEIGNKLIKDVIPSDIKNIYTNQYLTCSNAYIQAAKQLYDALFDAAVADGIIRSNPARDRSARPHRGTMPKNRPITKQEREWIETLCKNHRAYPIVMAMLYAGLRPQEAKAIKIDRDVDFENNTITVRETAHYEGKNYAFTEDGKTEWSNRTIPLFAPLKEALNGKEGYIITSAKGERISRKSWRVVWASYCKKMEESINGVRKCWYGRTKEHMKILADGGKLPPWITFDIHPYQLRHSYCCWLRDAGVELNTARKWMGHSDSKMILQVYDSVSEDRSDQERKKVENRLIGVQNGVQNPSHDPVMIEK